MMMPANYSVIAENEMTYVNGGALIDCFAPLMTSSNWKTFNTNLIKIIGNTFLGSFVSCILGTTFGTHYAFGDIGTAMNAKVANMDFFNTAMQVVAGIATIYSLGTDSASTVPHYTRYTYLVWDPASSIKVSILHKA